jgi:hypothetical protein
MVTTRFPNTTLCERSETTKDIVYGDSPLSCRRSALLCFDLEVDFVLRARGTGTCSLTMLLPGEKRLVVFLTRVREGVRRGSSSTKMVEDWDHLMG